MTLLEEIYEAAAQAAPSGADEELLQRLCRALQRTAENDVLHLGPAQRLGALLAHDPADGV